MHVLVIDEINRGNLAKVFGELYFLLEYRDREIFAPVFRRAVQRCREPLDHRDDEHGRPLDRAGGRGAATALLLCAVLSRRAAGRGPPSPLALGRKPTMLWVADVVDAANQILKDLDKRDMAVGPSYFMNKKLDEEWVKRIWKHSILPYVEEQLFGQTERLGEFELDSAPRQMSNARPPPKPMKRRRGRSKTRPPYQLSGQASATQHDASRLGRAGFRPSPE